MLNLFQGGKVTSGLSALRSEDSNCKGGDAAGSGMGRIGGDPGSGGDGIYGNGDDNRVCKRVRVVPALAPWGQARSPVEVGPETRLQHMRMDPPTLPVVHPLL
nr:hypothetical protein [Tanacetum cinerariifolium]